MKGRTTLEFMFWLAGFLLISAIPLLSTWSPAQSSAAPGGAERFVLQQLGSIDRQARALAGQAETYLDNPPREYDLYFRDAVIVSAFLDETVDGLDASIRGLGKRFDQVRASTESGAALDEVAGRIEALEQNWNRFLSGLNEQLGVDPEMPRLEWGYEHVAEQMPDVRRSIGELAEAVDAGAGAGSDQRASALPLVVLLAALALSVLALIRFRTIASRSA